MKRRDFIKSGAIGLIGSSSLLNNCDSKIKKETNSPRIIRKQSGKSDFQIGYIALRKDGQVGFSAIHDGFQYALYKKNENKLYDVKGIG